MLVRRACYHCLQEGMLYKLDKAGRPYGSCMCCGTRTFYHAREALAGPAAFAELVNQFGLGKVRDFVRGLGADPAALMASATQYVPPAPAPAPAPVEAK